MGAHFGLQHRQSQSLAINGQIIQSIKLLQLNQQELEVFVREQVDRNPLIDIAEPSEPQEAERRESPAPPSVEKPLGAAGEASPPVAPVRSRETSSDRFTPLRVSDDFARDTLASSLSFRDYLRAQLGQSCRSASDRRIAEEIIEALDDDGYFRVGVGAVADILDVPDAQVESVLARVQQLDPAGIAARDLRECLSLQLEDRGQLSDAMKCVLDNLDCLGRHDYRKLAAIARTDVDEIARLADLIRRLDPRPGRRFDSEPTPPAVPDVVVEMGEDGTFITSLVSGALPRVLVNRRYYSEVRSQCARGADARFVADCFRDANWLVRNLERRARTVLAVATAIVAHQRDFLKWGGEHLRPLSLRDVAEEVGVHQSTVSRAIANKFMMTSRGLYEFKYFFTNSVPTASDSENPSSDTVRHKIKRMVASETIDSVLSDDAIVRQLQEQGIEIARRTVAKYRENLRIPSSLQRRRQKETELALARTPQGERVAMGM